MVHAGRERFALTVIAEKRRFSPRYQCKIDPGYSPGEGTSSALSTSASLASATLTGR
jgi:hypothetical protein